MSPIEEPKRVIRCHFIGVTQGWSPINQLSVMSVQHIYWLYICVVPRATGVEVLNEAVDRLKKEIRRENWTLVDVHISPSAIAIFEAHNQQRQIASCRVRYLSFLGIGRDIKFAKHFFCFASKYQFILSSSSIQALCLHCCSIG